MVQDGLERTWELLGDTEDIHTVSRGFTNSTQSFSQYKYPHGRSTPMIFVFYYLED